MKLAELQGEFRSWLVNASAESAARLGPATGLTIYQNNYRTQLVDCLRTSYPQLHKRMGEREFLAAAISHIDAHPPHAWTLDAYATGFEQTLIQRHPDNPDLHELAWIELALAEAFVAADAEPVSLAMLQTIDWDHARLRMTPALRMRPAVTNAHDIWSALWQDEAAPESEMLAQAGALIVWRQGHVSRLRQLDALEREALSHLSASGSFSALCDMLVARLGEAEGAARAGALLASWLRSELIVGVEY